MPRRTNNPESIKRNRPWMLKFHLYFAKGRSRISQNVHATEAQMPGVPDHVEESDGSSPALGSVHPISGPGIICNIALAAIPDIKPVKGVIQNRQPYAEQFQTDDEREAAQKFNLFG